MDINELLDAILESGSKISRLEGKRLYANRLVSDIKGKNIEGIYHIYGKVKDEKIDKFYNAHIKFDLKNKKVVGCNCSCDDYLENKEIHSEFKCKHIMALAYTFYFAVKKKEKKSNATVKANVVKVPLKIEPRIKHRKEQGIDKYTVEFWIGEDSLALIRSINEFIYSVENKRFLVLNDNFTYNPHKHELNEESLRIYIFLNERISIKDSNQKKIVGRNIELKDNEIRQFIDILEDGKSLQINYNYINYKVELIKCYMPIHFNVKLKEGKIVTTTTNKMPIPLCSDLSVFFYDRKIYIPTEVQIKYLKGIYKPLMEKGSILLNNSNDNLIKILNIVSKISNDISLGEGIKRRLTSIIKPEFYFNEDNGQLYCKAIINYGICKVNLMKDINLNSFIRDINYEEKIVMELEKLKFIRAEGSFKFIGEDEDVYELLSSGLKNLVAKSEIYLSKSFQNINLITSKDLEYGFHNDNNQLDFNMKDFSIRELNSALDAMKNKKSFYKTEKNNYLDLKDEGVVEILNIFDSINSEGNIKDGMILLDKNQKFFLEESLKNRSNLFEKGKNAVEHMEENIENRKKVDVPTDLNATLRSYQIEGFNWLNEISAIEAGGILADEMGLGKTIQVIAFLLSKRDSKAMVITPTSLIYNWRDEFEKFAPELKVTVVHGDKNQREKQILEESNIILTTYGLVKNDYEKYKDMEFDYVIIDEAQNIKNSKSQNTKYVKSIKASCKIALTGTPIENNLMELWSIFDFIMPGYLLSEEKFKEKFVANKETEKIRELIEPFILRRVKKDVIHELPDKIEKKYIVEMVKEQKSIYKSYMKEIKEKLITEKNSITAFSYLTKLRQLCLDPALILDDYKGGSGKVNVAMDIIKDAIKENRKLLVFSQFTSVLANLQEILEKEKIKFYYLDGNTKAEKRIELVNSFNEGKDVKVFLISLKAGGTGLNLTSANLVLHFDPWWNPAIEDQATDRAHRIGQKNVVEVIKLVSKDTVEEKIVHLQDEKRKLIDEVMSGGNIGENIIGSLSNEEILELFN